MGPSALHQLEGPCWHLSTVKSAYISQVRIGSRCSERTRDCVHHLPKEEMVPGCRYYGKKASHLRQCDALSNILKENRRSRHSFMTHNTYLKHPIMATSFPGGSGLFHQDNAPCHTTKIIQVWFLLWPNSLDIDLITGTVGCTENLSMIFPSKFADPKLHCWDLAFLLWPTKFAD